MFDGMPPGAGVIGRTFSSGTPTVVSDVEASGEYRRRLMDSRRRGQVSRTGDAHGRSLALN